MRNFRREHHFDTSYAVRIQPPLQSGARVVEVGPQVDLVPPPLLTHPLQRPEYERYLGQQVPVTFLLDVPLRVIAEGDMKAFVTDIAFEEPVTLSGLQYRAVGVAYDQFDAQYEGRVYLQIICALEAGTDTGN